MLLNASRILHQEANEEMILLAIEDVTESKDRQRDLEIKVSERTRSLQQANSSLKHSNDSLEQYATIASHDLQEPLRKIRTFVNILNQRYGKQIEGEARELLGKIGLSAERMATLIQDVLNFAKVQDTGSFENADLDALSEACARNGRYEFQFVMAPLILSKGTASPVNPLASF